MAKKRASQAIVWAILGLLILALGGFGVTNFGGSVRSVGAVGNAEIDVTTYGRELQQELRAISAQTGRNITLAEAQALGIDRGVLGRLLNQAALEHEASDLKLSVGDETVADQVTEIPAFQGIDGQFDREAYAFTLENAGLSVAEFEDQVRKDTARNLLEAAVAGGIALPDVLTATLFAYAREERDITWSLLGPADFDAGLPEPNDATLRAFHAENEARFTLPETRAITYSWITPDMMLDSIEPDDDALRALYDERLSEFVQPERRLVERLVFGTESEAQTERERIEAGETTFEAAVADRGLELSDIDMGDVTAADLGDAGDAVFALDGPGLAGPLPSPLGPALYRVNAILSATKIRFEEARDELTAELAADRARREIDAMIGDIEDLLAGGATLEELGAETAMETGRIDFRPDSEDGIAAYPEFRDAALLAETGDFPELIEIEGGGLFALRLDEIVPPALQPFEDVRDEVADAWAGAETTRLLTERAQEAAQAIEDGAEMAGLDLSLRVARGLTRDGFVEDAPAQLVDNVFQMAEDDVRVFAAEGGAALVRLDAIRPADQDAPEAQAVKAQFSAQAAQEIAQDALQMFTRAIQAEAGIEVNAQAISAIHAQFP